MKVAVADPEICDGRGDCDSVSMKTDYLVWLPVYISTFIQLYKCVIPHFFPHLCLALVPSTTVSETKHAYITKLNKEIVPLVWGQLLLPSPPGSATGK
jgi:hypothetical protein